MRKATLTGLVLILASTVGTALAKTDIIEQYKGNAMVMSGGGGSSLATINIYRWSSDDERNEILEAIKHTTDNPRPRDRKVAQALRGLPKAGYAFFANQQGYPLRYARRFERDGKVTIILATDRPVSFQEVYKQSQIGDYDVSVVVLQVDDSGKGEGVLSLGTEVRWNSETNRINVTNVTSQPIKIMGLHKTK